MLTSLKATNLALFKRGFASTALKMSEPELNINLSHSDDPAPEIELPTSENLNSFTQDSNGIPGVLSQRVFEDVWTKQSQLRLEDLKYGIKESPGRADLESCFVSEQTAAANPFLRRSGRKANASSLMQDYSLTTSNPVIDKYYKVLKKTTKQPTEDYVFQNASSIYNLYYFLSSLKPTDTQLPTDKNALKQSLLETPDVFAPVSNTPPLTNTIYEPVLKNFGSWEEFQALLLSSANAITGNGSTWLVHRFIKPENASYQSRELARFSTLAVVNTYDNGTPHQFRSGQVSSARRYREKRAASGSELSESSALGLDEVEIPSVSEAQDTYEVFEFTYEPLLAIGVNPSFYLRDYGVYGKKQYLSNVWNSIDWDVVQSRLTDGLNKA